MNGESRMDGDDLPTRADVEAVKAWTGLGNFDPLGGEQTDTAYGEGRTSIAVPSSGTAREVEGAARARGERHGEEELGTVWVRPADGMILTTWEAGLDTAGEEDVPS